MKDERTATTMQFECRNCDRRFSPISYLAACPRCGGALRTVAVARR